MSTRSRPIPPTPSRVDRLMFPLFEFLRRDERAAVADPRRLRRLIVTGLLTFAAAIFSLVAVRHAHGWLGFAASMFFGLCAGRVSLIGLRRAISYRTGWLEGRHRMVLSLRESAERGLTLEDWLQGELERDVSIVTGSMGFIEFPPRGVEDGDE